MKRFAALGVAAFAAGCAAGPTATLTAAPEWSRRPPVRDPSPFRVPAVQQGMLANGVAVLFVRRTDVPLMEVDVVMRGGTGVEPRGKAGVATLAAALMTGGAGARTADQIAEAADLSGASLDVSADRESLRTLVRVPAAHLDSALALVADVVLHPYFPADLLTAARARRVTSLAQVRDQPNNLAGIALSRVLFGAEHPAGSGILGSPREVASITREDLIALHRAHLRPDRTAIVVVGETTWRELLPRLERVFGGQWAPRTMVPAGRSALPPRQQVGITIVDRPGATQSTLRITRLAPPRSSRDYLPLEVANMVLGGSTTSRLGQALRERHGFSYEARSFFEWRADTSLFIAYAAVETPVTAVAVREFLEVFSSMDSISAEDVSSAKRILQGAFTQPFMTIGGVAQVLGDAFIHGVSAAALRTYDGRLHAVSFADVRRVSRTLLDPQGLSIVIIGDRSAIEQDLRPFGIPVSLLDASTLLPPVP